METRDDHCTFTRDLTSCDSLSCMKIDRTIKFLLAAIAIALWMNVAISLWRPDRVRAQDLGDVERRLSSIESSVDSIQSDVDSIETGVRSLQGGVTSMEDSVSKIATGLCTNDKIC